MGKVLANKKRGLTAPTANPHKMSKLTSNQVEFTTPRSFIQVKLQEPSKRLFTAAGIKNMHCCTKMNFKG